MTDMPAVRRFTTEDAPAAALIIEGLPDYFTEDVPEKCSAMLTGMTPGCLGVAIA
jgi:hypothetical protein